MIAGRGTAENFGDMVTDRIDRMADKIAGGRTQDEALEDSASELRSVVTSLESVEWSASRGGEIDLGELEDAVKSLEYATDVMGELAPGSEGQIRTVRHVDGELARLVREVHDEYGRWERDGTRHRRGKAEVERTKPGSKNDFRLEYDASKKWTNDDPRDGVGEDGELESIFNELDVKRMVKKLEKAVKAYLDGSEGAESSLKAVGKEMDRVLGSDRARTVVRALKKSVDNVKVKKALSVTLSAVDGGKKAMDRNDRIARELVAVARELVSEFNPKLVRCGSEQVAGRLVGIASVLINSGTDYLSPEAMQEIKDDVMKALGGIPRGHRRNPEVKKMQKDVMRALNSM